ncbi:hypothetical protein HIM_02234 [Hirsutella minnesotensis 3608]|nr:hypothetical protein HIM_02234 [Hirsutella minnesotensis 3608]
MKLGHSFVPFMATTAFATVLSYPDGPYGVRWESRELVDQGRVDPFNSSHARRLMISRFSPIARFECEICRVPYMPPAVARIEDEILDAYMGSVGWPKGIFANLELDVCCQTQYRHTRRHRFPTVLFGPGLNTTRLFYTATAQHLASAGLDVIVLDHPYETDVVQFPDGDLIFGGRIGKNPKDESGLVRGLDVRSRDVSFVLDRLDIRRAIYVGQSFGGASVAATMLTENRILGGVNLDGELWGPARQSGVGKPFLIIGAEGHNGTSLPGWGAFNKSMAEKHEHVWFKILNVKDAVHGSFLDFSIIGDVAGLRGRKGLEDFLGTISGWRVMNILQVYIREFVEFAFFGMDEDLLRGPDPRFPEVSFLKP